MLRCLIQTGVFLCYKRDKINCFTLWLCAQRPLPPSVELTSVQGCTLVSYHGSVLCNEDVGRGKDL
jgi:hypothetical protein